MRKVGLGLVGLGYIGKVHLRHCLSLESAELLAVADLSKKALSYAKRMGAHRVFTDYKQLLKDPNIDGVLIALPTYLHAACVESAAEAGKAIFVEKPLARSVDEGKEIVSRVRKNGVKLMVGYDMRFFPPFRSLKQKMQNGILGDVQMAYGTNIGAGPFFHRAESSIPKPVPAWWFSREMTGGGAVMDLGCHLINLFHWYFGEVTSVKSYLGRRYNLNVEDHATCMLKFASGTIGVINVGWFSQEAQKKVELLGTVRHDEAFRVPENRILAAIKLLTTNSTKYESTFLRELQHFVHCIQHDLPPSPSGDEGLRDLDTISMVYENQIVL